MDEKQKSKFLTWCEKRGFVHDNEEALRTMVGMGWQACLDANGIGEVPPGRDKPDIPEGLYRIGEEVEARGSGNLWYSGKIGVVIDKTRYGEFDNIEVRRKPAWTPKVDEPVFIVRGGDSDVSVCKFSHVDEHEIWRVITVKGQEQGFTASLVKPFDASKIGRPWSEI